MSKIEKSYISKIYEKLLYSLSENDLIFIKKYIHKHWYNSLYNVLPFESYEILKKL